MFIALPRATRSEDKTPLHNIPTLGINFSKKDAMALVSFSATTTRDILVSQVVDESAKFTIGNKLVSMSKQFDKEPMFFDNWYDNWDLKTLAYWLKRLYSHNSLNGKTIEEELYSYKFELESPAMDLKSSDRTGEDKKLQTLHSILLRFPGPENYTPDKQTALVKILYDKLKNTHLGREMLTNGKPRTTVQEFIISFLDVRETYRNHFSKVENTTNRLPPNLGVTPR